MESAGCRVDGERAAARRSRQSSGRQQQVTALHENSRHSKQRSTADSSDSDSNSVDIAIAVDYNPLADDSVSTQKIILIRRIIQLSNHFEYSIKKRHFHKDGLKGEKVFHILEVVKIQMVMNSVAESLFDQFQIENAKLRL